MLEIFFELDFNLFLLFIDLSRFHDLTCIFGILAQVGLGQFFFFQVTMIFFKSDII
jgi:hypothetical protein